MPVDLETKRQAWLDRAASTESRLLASVYRRKANDLELEIATQTLTPSKGLPT